MLPAPEPPLGVHVIPLAGGFFSNSPLMKKNNLFFIIGPPIVAPYILLLNGGLLALTPATLSPTNFSFCQ